MNRRQLIKNSLGAMAASAVGMSLSGCNVYSDIENWISVAIASVNSIVSILGANGIFPFSIIVNAVLGALNTVKLAIDEYKSTTPAPVGAVEKIETALKDVVDQFGAFLRSLGIQGGLFTIIANLVEVILSTISGFLTKLPAQTFSNTNRISVSIAMTSQVMGLHPVPTYRTVRKFKKDYNSILDTSNAYDVLVPKSAYHKITIFERIP